MGAIDVYHTKVKHTVMSDTWGHMYPEPGSKHKGKILVIHDLEHQTVMGGRCFPTLCSSPQEYELVCSVLDLYDWTCGVHEIECTLWFFKSSNDMYLGERIGKIIKPKLRTLYTFNEKSYGY